MWTKHSLAIFLQTLVQQSATTAAAEALQTIQDYSEKPHQLIPAVLDTNTLDESVFLSSLANSLGLAWWGEQIDLPSHEIREVLPARVALKFHVLPVTPPGSDDLYILTYNPFNLIAKQAVAQNLDTPYQWAIAPRKTILDALRATYGVGADTFEEILEGRDIDEALADLKQETTILDEDDTEASVVKFVNQILREALELRATDIHIEPLEDDLQIRYRIDGILREIPVPSQIKLLQASVISRIKIMAQLDIAERRIPQDGRINLEMDGNPIDVRVATIPSVTGESVSLRLLGQNRFDFEAMGMADDTFQKIKELLALPNGIILVTGPTGCGKSTTLYTFLTKLNTKERRIVTIEDPVENKIPGVVQIAVKPEINLTFAMGLRSILRGDPNVVMVGEMRDVETAEIAIRAALTGHLVFSTLHTNDSVGGITRLLDMGIEPFLVSSSVRAFIAQRLVRVLCPKCKTPATYSETYLDEIGFPAAYRGATIYKPAGCPNCHHSGYLGRTAIYELCMVTQAMQDLIAKNVQGNILKQQAIKDGMRPLRADGWRKVVSGETSIEEVLRVTALEASEEIIPA